MVLGRSFVHVHVHVFFVFVVVVVLFVFVVFVVLLLLLILLLGGLSALGFNRSWVLLLPVANEHTSGVSKDYGN